MRNPLKPILQDHGVAYCHFEENERHDLTIQRSNGASFESEVCVHSIPVGNTQGTAVIVRDVTLQRNAFETMREAKAAAEAANATKTEFMASVSHELRTPLGGVIGLADLLAGTSLTERGQQYVDLIRHSASLLADVIEDILDFSSIEAGHLQVEPAPIDLHRVIGNAFKCVAARAIDKPIRLVFSIHPNTPRFVLGDAKRLRQIVINLCGNAIKFTPSGEVRLRLSTLESSSGSLKPNFRIDVVDTGIGIPLDKQKSVFEAFEQGEKGTTKRFGGTGLGLAITRGLVQQMGGQVTLNSAAGAGSQFCVEIYLQENDSPGQGVHERVLVPDRISAFVDLGNREMNQSIVETLESLKIDVEPRPSDATLILRSEKLSDGRVIEARDDQRLIWISKLGSPIIDTRPGDVVLMEPVIPDDLFHAIAAPEKLESQYPSTKSSDRRNGAEVHPEAVANESSGLANARARILLVDDSELNRTVLRDQLEFSGYQVETASCGSEGVDKALSIDFDCILMDLQMPDMDGTEAMLKIRQQHQEQEKESPPVIALTAHVTAEHRKLCKDAGMDGFLTKPVTRELLIDEVSKHVSQDAITTEMVDNSLQNENVEPENDMTLDNVEPNSNGYSDDDPWRERMKAVGGNRAATVISICDAFLQEVPMLSKNIRACVERDDANGLRTAAHTLKSCLRYVAIEKDVKKIETIEKQSADPSSVTSAQVDEAQTIAEHWVGCVGTLKKELEQEIT